MANKQRDGLKYQKKAARKMGGKYCGKKFIGHSVGDISIGDLYHVESKLLAKIPSYLDDILNQSMIDSLRGFKIDGDSISMETPKWPIAIIQGRGVPWNLNVVVMRAGDFMNMREYYESDDG